MLTSFKQRSSIRRACKLKGVARAVLMVMVDLAGNDRLCWASIATISAEAGFSHRAVASAIAKLVEAGEIVCAGGGNGRVVTYRIENSAARPMQEVHGCGPVGNAGGAYPGGETHAGGASVYPQPMHEVHTKESLYSEKESHHISARARAPRRDVKNLSEKILDSQAESTAQSVLSTINGHRGSAKAWDALTPITAGWISTGHTPEQIVAAAALAAAQGRTISSPRYLERILTSGAQTKAPAPAPKPLDRMAIMRGWRKQLIDWGRTPASPHWRGRDSIAAMIAAGIVTAAEVVAAGYGNLAPV